MSDMQSENSLSDNDCVVILKLPQKLTLHDAVQLKDVLVETGMKKAGVTLDFADVKDVKTPIVQVVLAAQDFFSTHGLNFKISNANEVVKSLFEDLGLLSTFSKMEG